LHQVEEPIVAVSSDGRSIAIRLTVLLLGLLIVRYTPSYAQKQSERHWLAGRYDGNRVVVYFDAVTFNGTMTANAREIPPPVVGGFFDPVELPASYIAQFQRTPNAEHFALGDRYDLLVGNGVTTTIRLTTLVGCETDEGVGNDSFIGAIGTLEKSTLFLTKGYYVVRRHRDAKSDAAKPNPGAATKFLKYASLLNEPTRLDIQTQIARLLAQQLEKELWDAKRAAAAKASPAMQVQAFQLADGSLRYYAQAQWKTGKKPGGAPTQVLGAWLAPNPTLHILAVEEPMPTIATGPGALPELLNVIDLGAGKVGVIVHFVYGESVQLELAEYRDGATVKDMPVLQSISTGE
jgi:hypothetical protein